MRPHLGPLLLSSLPHRKGSNYWLSSSSSSSSTASSTLSSPVSPLPSFPHRLTGSYHNKRRLGHRRRPYFLALFIFLSAIVVYLWGRYFVVAFILLRSYAFDTGIIHNDVIRELQIRSSEGNSEWQPFDQVFPTPTDDEAAAEKEMVWRTIMESEESGNMTADAVNLRLPDSGKRRSARDLPSELEAESHTDVDSEPFPADDQLPVPKIIHQVLLGSLDFKPTWKLAQSECKRLHPGWDFRLWRDDDSEAFIAKHYPDILTSWKGYDQTIQRTNILRYLLLHHYGGIYLDLDLRCRVNLEPLRQFPLVTPPAPPAGVNNAFIASRPGHPLWEKIISNINYFNLHWFSPYISNMASTGCLFFTAMHFSYKLPSPLHLFSAYDPREPVWILPGKENRLSGHIVTPLFEHLGASSWHGWDAAWIFKLRYFIEWIGSAGFWLCFIVALTSIVGVVVWGILFTRRRSRRSYRRGRQKHHDRQYFKLALSPTASSAVEILDEVDEEGDSDGFDGQTLVHDSDSGSTGGTRTPTASPFLGSGMIPSWAMVFVPSRGGDDSSDSSDDTERVVLKSNDMA